MIMENIGVLDACRQFVNIGLLRQGLEAVGNRKVTVVSHPIQKSLYARQCASMVRYISTEPSGRDAIEWVESVDMLETEIHLETPDGRFLIKNLHPDGE